MTVKRAVYSWSIRFRSAGYGNEQLARISTEYLEDLQSEGVTPAQFEAAAMAVRKRCRFFPSMADILEAVAEHRARPPQPKSDTLQLSDTTSMHDLTPEEVERNKERIQIILKALSKELTIEEAVEMVSMKSHIAEFVTDGQIQSDLRPD